MKKLLILLFITPFLFSACSNNADNEISDNPPKDELVFWHITDTHYLSPSLNINSPDFIQMMLNADGKITHYSHDMVLAFKEHAIESQPDVILVSGDLTFNGEKQSHLDFANILSEISDSGITILTIPGNHDIDYPFAYSYIDNKAIPTENISMNDFEDIYSNFGFDGAISKHQASLSYIYKYNSDVYFLGLDTSSSGNGVVLDETLTWLETALSEIPENATIISMTHQNLFIHNEGFEAGFVIDKHEELSEILKKYKVELNLSGHMHIQNVFTDGNLTDIATSAYSLFTTRYAVIEYNKGHLNYSSHSINIDNYAKNNNLTNTDLLHFSEYSLDFYYQSAYSKALSSFTDLDISSDEKHLMADFIAKMNTSYFQGSLKDDFKSLENHRGYSILNSIEINSFFKEYINTVMSAPLVDDLNWSNQN